MSRVSHVTDLFCYVSVTVPASLGRHLSLRPCAFDVAMQLHRTRLSVFLLFIIPGCPNSAVKVFGFFPGINSRVISSPNLVQSKVKFSPIIDPSILRQPGEA